MDQVEDHELLMRHARAWAAKKSRTLHEDVLADVLRLRNTYDDLPYGTWPPGSAERLLLQTWPAYGPPPPEEERLRETLDTFWGFLRATGRMSTASAAPAELRKEARRALPHMLTAYDDTSRHSPGRALRDFGGDLGIDLDGAEDVEELQQRVAQVTEAWNALPTAERLRLMPDPSPKSGLAAEMTAALQGDDLPPGGMPRWPEVEPDDDDEDLEVASGRPEVSAEQARASGFVQDCLRLAAWVGDGKEATARGLLRPSVAREAYQHLDLWPWERAYDALRHRETEVSDDPQVDALMAEAALRSWHSAGDCLPLDRLWYAVDVAGLVEVRGRTAHRNLPDPSSDEEWRDLAVVLMIAMCVRLGDWATEPLAGVLLLAAVADEPVPLDAVRAWWGSRMPDGLREIDIGWDRRLDEVWHLFADCEIWRFEDDVYTITDLGRDFLLAYLNALEAGFFDGD